NGSSGSQPWRWRRRRCSRFLRRGRLGTACSRQSAIERWIIRTRLPTADCLASAKRASIPRTLGADGQVLRAHVRDSASARFCGHAAAILTNRIVLVVMEAGGFQSEFLRPGGRCAGGKANRQDDEQGGERQTHHLENSFTPGVRRNNS